MKDTMEKETWEVEYWHIDNGWKYAVFPTKDEAIQFIASLVGLMYRLMFCTKDGCEVDQSTYTFEKAQQEVWSRVQASFQAEEKETQSQSAARSLTVVKA
jgi:hypothetical protein